MSPKQQEKIEVVDNDTGKANPLDEQPKGIHLPQRSETMPKKETSNRQYVNEMGTDELTSESLAAAAIWEQIEQNRQKEGLSPQDKSTQPPQIDPSFQRDYNNI